MAKFFSQKRLPPSPFHPGRTVLYNHDGGYWFSFFLFSSFFLPLSPPAGSRRHPHSKIHEQHILLSTYMKREQHSGVTL